MMTTEKVNETAVLNIMDGREICFTLPPDRAVVAAYELFELGKDQFDDTMDPASHPDFKEFSLGFACGDWIAYKDSRILNVH
jgi:hypothetical protein